MRQGRGPPEGVSQLLPLCFVVPSGQLGSLFTLVLLAARVLPKHTVHAQLGIPVSSCALQPLVAPPSLLAACT